MIWILQNWKTLAVVGLCIAATTFGWTLGSNHVQHKWDAERMALLEAANQAALENVKIITALEKTKHDNLTEIDRLRANNHALWVRLPTSPCANANSAVGGLDTAAGSWVAVTQTQSAFDNFTSGLAEDAAGADKVIEDCRVVIDWVNRLPR